MEPDQVPVPRIWVAYQVSRENGGEWHASKPLGATETLAGAQLIAERHAREYWRTGLGWVGGGGAMGLESYQAAIPNRLHSHSKPWHHQFPDTIESEIAYVVEGF